MRKTASTQIAAAALFLAAICRNPSLAQPTSKGVPRPATLAGSASFAKEQRSEAAANHLVIVRISSMTASQFTRDYMFSAIDRQLDAQYSVYVVVSRTLDGIVMQHSFYMPGDEVISEFDAVSGKYIRMVVRGPKTRLAPRALNNTGLRNRRQHSVEYAPSGMLAEIAMMTACFVASRSRDRIYIRTPLR